MKNLADGMSAATGGAIEAEVKFVTDQLRADTPFLFMVGALLRDGTLKDLVTMKGPAGPSGPVVKMVRKGCDSFKNFSEKEAERLVAVIVPDLMTEELMDTYKVAALKYKPILNFMLNADKDTPLPTAEFPQCKEWSNLGQVLTVRYALLGSRRRFSFWSASIAVRARGLLFLSRGFHISRVRNCSDLNGTRMARCVALHWYLKSVGLGRRFALIVATHGQRSCRSVL